MDERSAIWKYLMSLSSEKVLLIGNAPLGMIQGIARTAKSVLVASGSEAYLNQLSKFSTENEISDIQSLTCTDTSLPPLPDNSIHAIGIATNIGLSSIETLIRECHRILTPGGSICLMIRKENWITRFAHPANELSPGATIGIHCDAKNIQKLLQRALFMNIRKYGVVPGHKEPRWMIPSPTRQIATTSLQVYNPTSANARAKKWMARLLSRMGLSRLWMSDLIVIAQKALKSQRAHPRGLRNLLREVLDRPDIEVALSAGTTGYYRKVTAQVMSPDGCILAYAKIADTEQTRNLLDNEANILKRLENIRLITAEVPKLLYHGTCGRDTVFIQSTLEDLSYGPRWLDERHISFLVELFHRTAVHKPLKECLLLFRVEERLKRLRERISESWYHRIRTVLKRMIEQSGNYKILQGLSHGDFAPWNTFLHQDKLFVFDWEYAWEESIPFWDIFHFVIQHGVLVEGLDASKLLGELTGENGSLLPLLHQYAERLGIHPSLSTKLLLLYLCDVSSFYLETYMQDEFSDRQRNRLLDTWGRMLESLQRDEKIFS